MNKNRMRSFLEIIYNCPLILLVLITSLLVMAFSDVLNMGGMEENRTVSCLANEGDKENKGEDDGAEEIKKEDNTALNMDHALAGKEEGVTGKNSEMQEDAGTNEDEKNNIEDRERRKDDIQKAENMENTGKEKHGITDFVEYTPVTTDSRYYSDAGKVALTTNYDYEIENESYFNDAAFLGDSRTLGISDYAGLDGADFFCDNGMTIYKLLEDEGVTYQKTGKKVDMKQILQEKHYGKIYIMLGMNELGYGDTPMYMKQYLKVIRQIKEWQPGVTIYIMANLHVSREKNNMETEFNNININDKNVASARLANGRDVFYLDCNPLFTDEEGYLQAELTFDGVHLYAQYYDKWRDFLFTHGVDREGTGMEAAQGGGGYGGDETE